VINIKSRTRNYMISSKIMVYLEGMSVKGLQLVKRIQYNLLYHLVNLISLVVGLIS